MFTSLCNRTLAAIGKTQTWKITDNDRAQVRAFLHVFEGHKHTFAYALRKAAENLGDLEAEQLEETIPHILRDFGQYGKSARPVSPDEEGRTNHILLLTRFDTHLSAINAAQRTRKEATASQKSPFTRPRPLMRA